LRQNWTLPEHLWVCMNVFESVLNTPWMLVSAHECLWVSIEHPLNTCECAWTPLSEYWTCSECLWVQVNANEWVRTSPEHQLGAHECLCVSFRKVWMRTSRVVDLKNLSAGSNWEFEHWHKLGSYVMDKKNMQTFLGPAKICMVFPCFYRILQRAR
jgi:hypothetical protein